MKAKEETDKKKLNESLDSAGLKEKVESLDRGIETELLKIIANDGTDFSGGEKQKIAIARALYKDSPCIVLDEPDSALDAFAEKQFYDNFEKHFKSKTVLLISHRLSSVNYCNKIAVFDKGKIVEYGTKDELLQKDGMFSKVWKNQALGYQENV